VFCLVSWGGVRLSPLGTSVTNWPIVPAPDDDDECGAVGGMRIGRGNRSTRRKPAPVPLCPPQIPHHLTWARTRAAAVGSRRLTAYAMARPITVFGDYIVWNTRIRFIFHMFGILNIWTSKEGVVNAYTGVRHNSKKPENSGKICIKNKLYSNQLFALLEQIWHKHSELFWDARVGLWNYEVG
jgi:hypothetical protein